MKQNKYWNGMPIAAVIFLIGLSYTPFLLAYTESFAYSSIRAADEMAYLRTITENLFKFEWSINYFQKFHTFGYGQSWWAFMSLILLPGYLLDSERAMFITARASSLGFYLASLWIIYLSLADIIRTKFHIIFLACLFFIASLMQITIIKANLIYCDTAYLFFLTLAIFYLKKDSGSFSKNFHYSLVFFLISLSIKGTPIPAAIIYPTYLFLHFKSFPFSLKFIFKSLFTCIFTILVLNPTFLHPDLLEHFLKIIKNYSEVARNGWPDVQHSYSISTSIKNFEQYYLSLPFIAFIIIAPIALEIIYFFNKRNVIHGVDHAKNKFRQQTYWLFALPLCSVVSFGLFYTWLPNHFAFSIVTLFIPVTMITGEKIIEICSIFFGKVGQNIQEKKLTNLSGTFLLIALLLVNYQQMRNSYGILRAPEPETSRVIAIKQIQKGIDKLDFTPSFVGVAHELGMPRINGSQVDHWMLNELPTHLILKSDLLIFWEADDKFKRLYKVQNPYQRQAYENFQKITNNQLIANQIKFHKIFDDEGILFFRAEKLRKITEKKQVGNYGAVKAFDNSAKPNDFWEYPAGDKTWISVEFLLEPKSITKYTLTTGEEPKKMPQEWRVMGLSQEKIWVPLDSQSGQIDWKPDESRTFSFKQVDNIHGIKIEFHKGNNPHVVRVYEISFE